jgi:hypothetical protein
MTPTLICCLQKLNKKWPQNLEEKKNAVTFEQTDTVEQTEF